jgi:hypothetical protein
MATFRIRFVNSPGFISDAIDILSDARVDHCEFDSGTGWLGAHYQDGVQNRPYDYMTPSREYIFGLDVDALNLADGMAWAKSCIGRGYNFGAIVGIELHIPSITQVGKLICSQYGYLMCRKLGFNPLNKQVVNSWNVTPGALMLSPIFDGKLISSKGA